MSDDYKDAAAKLHGLLNGAAESAERAMAPAKPVQATVSNVTADGVYVKTDGDDTAKGPFPATVKVVIGDRVGIAQVGGTWTVNDNFTNPAADQETVGEAWTKANAAQVAAEAASGAASQAQASAATAAGAAEAAQGSAATAANAATSAQGSASSAASSASSAASSASAAASDASAAAGSAASAASNAAAAVTSANQANAAARGALSELGSVEDVLGTLNWITNHATFAPTADSAIDPSKVYYVADQSSPYGYAVVAEPDVSEISTYYEMSIDAALSNYVASHLALTNDGLFLLQDGNGYRLKLNANGWYIINPQGNVVNQATGNGSDVGPTSGRHIHVGSSSIDMMNGANVDGWSIGSALQLIKNGVSYIWAGLENAVSLVRVGLASAGNVVMSGDGYVDVRHGSEVMAHFGYGPGASASGTSTRPYYTMGTRNTGGVGNYSTAEGFNVVASGFTAHAEGDYTTASGNRSHAEGCETTASGFASHAEGDSTTASGGYSHAEGLGSLASGYYAHAGGYFSKATHGASFAHGKGVETPSECSAVVGEYNDKDNSGVFTVGIGSDDTHRANGFIVGATGIAYAKGGVMSDGPIQGTSISDGTGTLAQLRESVSRTIINIEQEITTSTSLAYTGVNVTIPGGSVFALYGQAVFNNSSPQEVAITDRSTASSTFYRLAHSDTSGVCVYAGYVPTDMACHLWARYGSSAKNKVRLRGWYMPAQ